MAGFYHIGAENRHSAIDPVADIDRCVYFARMGTEKAASKEEILEEHLFYEIWMLLHTDKALRAPPSTVTQNALIESFCIHARQLLDFFENKQGVHAKDFTTDGTYVAAHFDGFRSQRKKLNTQIAHLTAHRTKDPNHKILEADRILLRDALLCEAHHFQSRLRHDFVTRFKVPSLADYPDGPPPHGFTGSSSGVT